MTLRPPNRALAPRWAWLSLALLGIGLACKSSQPATKASTEVESQRASSASSAPTGRRAATVEPSEPSESQPPQDPGLRQEVLPSGVTFYSRPVEVTTDRLQLMLVARVGWLSEGPQQEGFAHLVEHLAFRGGTEHFSAAERAALLRRSGSPWSREHGGWTHPESTVYALVLPRDQPELVDQAILLMSEWASALRFEAEDVAAERAIVVAERKEHRDERAFSVAVEQRLLAGSAYAERAAREPELSVAPAAPAAVEAFYRRWYHPANLAVIAVGAFDEERVSRQVRATFGRLSPRPSGARLEPPEIAVEPGLHVSALRAPGATPRLHLVMTQPARPSAVGLVTREELLDLTLDLLIAWRLAAAAESPESPLGSDQSFQHDLRLPRQLARVRVALGVQGGRFEEATRAVLRELRRLALHPPPAEEVQSVLSAVSGVMRKKAATSTLKTLSNLLHRAFLTGERPVGVDQRDKSLLNLLPTLSVEHVHRRLAQWFERGERHLLVVGGPEAALPTEQKLAAIAAAVGRERPEALSAVEPLRELLAARPDSGRVGVREALPAIGAYRWKLENGAVVLFKPTRVPGLRLQALSPGGWARGSASDPATGRLAAAGVQQAGLAGHPEGATIRYLGARGVRLTVGIGAYEEALEGSAAEGEAEALFQALHLRLQGPSRDQAAFDAFRERYRQELLEPDPEQEFHQAIDGQLWPGQPHYAPLADADVAKLDFQEAQRFFSERFGDLSDFTFVFVGKAEVEELESLVGAYLASLPTSATRRTPSQPLARRRPGITRVRVAEPGSATSRVRVEFHGQASLSARDRTLLDTLRQVLWEALFEALRTRAEAIYHVKTWGAVDPPPLAEHTLGFEFECEPGRAEELKATALSVVAELLRQGPPEAYVAQARKRYQTRLRYASDSAWLRHLVQAQRYGEDPNRILESWQAGATLSRAELRTFARRIVKLEQYVDAVQEGGS